MIYIRIYNVICNFITIKLHVYTNKSAISLFLIYNLYIWRKRQKTIDYRKIL